MSRISEGTGVTFPDPNAMVMALGGPSARGASQSSLRRVKSGASGQSNGGRRRADVTARRVPTFPQKSPTRKSRSSSDASARRNLESLFNRNAFLLTWGRGGDDLEAVGREGRLRHGDGGTRRRSVAVVDRWVSA